LARLWERANPFADSSYTDELDTLGMSRSDRAHDRRYGQGHAEY
jgi:hypothetical protein